MFLALSLCAPAAWSGPLGELEFTDVVSIDVPGGVDFRLTTSEDAYVFIPNGLFADAIEVSGAHISVVGDSQLSANTISLCGPPACPLQDFDLARDVVVMLSKSPVEY